MSRKNRYQQHEKQRLIEKLRSLPGLAIFVVFGVLFHMVVLNIQIISGVESGKWLRGQGTVIDARVVSHSGSGERRPYFEVTVDYRYRVLGTVYTGNRATVGGGWYFSSEKEAHKKADNLKKRPEVPVYYDPDDPSRSVLEAGAPQRDLFGLVVSIPALGVAVGMLTGSLVTKRRRVTGVLAGTATALSAGLVQWIILTLTICGH